MTNFNYLQKGKLKPCGNEVSFIYFSCVPYFNIHITTNADVEQKFLKTTSPQYFS